MKRRSFLENLMYFLGLSVVFGASTACDSGSSSSGGSGDDEDDDDDAALDCPGGGTVTYTNAGHAHTTINLTDQEIDDAVVGTYTLMGGGHTHTFTLTAQDFVDLKNNITVSKNDLEGHSHNIDIVCAP